MTQGEAVRLGLNMWRLNAPLRPLAYHEKKNALGMVISSRVMSFITAHVNPCDSSPPMYPSASQVTGLWSKAKHSFDQRKDLFEKNSVDHFVVRIPDCGDLQSVRFWHDGSGFGSDW